MAVCDVSGSMGCLESGYDPRRPPEPIFPALALSLFLTLLFTLALAFAVRGE